jgi:ElaA protein
MKITWTCKFFDDLTPRELYVILRLRNEVFVVEQNCVFQDADNKDFYSWHLMGWMNQELVAYTRLLPKGLAYDEASIGRVVNSPSVRGKGIGQELMSESIKKLFELFGPQSIHIGAQLYLKKFYESFGFQATGAIYLEDGIEHIEMVRPKPQS